MIFRTRKLIRPSDLNPRGTLFGGQVLKWIDEEAAIFAICQLDNSNIVTKIMSEVDFVSSQIMQHIISHKPQIIQLYHQEIYYSIFFVCEMEQNLHSR